MQAVNLKVAERYVEAFSDMAKTNNTMIVPANLADLSTLGGYQQFCGQGIT
jgi:hypothetical protein